MNVRDLIKKHEAVRAKPYKDTVGKLTVGVGRNLDDRGLRPDEIELLLTNDLQEAWDECAKYPWFLPLSEARKAACLDLMFNLGASRFRGFQKFIAAMGAKDYQKAGDELVDSAWFTQVKTRGPDIVHLIRYETWPT